MFSNCGLSCYSGCTGACDASCAGTCFGHVDFTDLYSVDDDVDKNDTSDKTTIDMTCESCGGMMQLQNEIGHHVLYCPYCRTKRVLV